MVTGVSRRQAIGAAVARRLAADGASVFLQSWSAYDRQTAWGADPNGPDELVGELRGTGARAGHQAVDFSDPGAPAAVMRAAQDAFGHVDILVANHARSHRQNLQQLTAAELDTAFAVNTRATLLLVQAFAAQHDDTRSGGRVFLFTSGQYHGAMPDELPYIASKAALHELTRASPCTSHPGTSPSTASIQVPTTRGGPTRMSSRRARRGFPVADGAPHATRHA